MIKDATYYECVYTNPYPDKKIERIRIDTLRDDKFSILVKEIAFL